MQRLLPRMALTLCLLLAACGTPPEVKQLSMAQIGYFDAAIRAVELQSEALLLAAQQIRSQAEARIVEIEKNSLARNKTLALELSSLEGGRREAVAEEMLSKVARVSRTAAAARGKLARDVAMIERKTQALRGFIGKLKQVHLALDAYLQSEQAGERVLRDVLKQPSVQRLLSTANELLPRVTGTMDEIKALIGDLNRGDEL